MVEPEAEHSRHRLRARVPGWLQPGRLQGALDLARRAAQPDIGDERGIELLDRHRLRRRRGVVEGMPDDRCSRSRRRREPGLRNRNRDGAREARQDRARRVCDGDRPDSDGVAAAVDGGVDRNLVDAVGEGARVEREVVRRFELRGPSGSVQREVDVVDVAPGHLHFEIDGARDDGVRRQRREDRQRPRLRDRRRRRMLDAVGRGDRRGQGALRQRRLGLECCGRPAEDAGPGDGADLGSRPVAAAGVCADGPRANARDCEPDGEHAAARSHRPTVAAAGARAPPPKRCRGTRPTVARPAALTAPGRSGPVGDVRTEERCDERRKRNRERYEPAHLGCLLAEVGLTAPGGAHTLFQARAGRELPTGSTSDNRQLGCDSCLAH